MQHNATQHSTVPCYCERPCVLKGLWAIYLERETKSFSPFLLLWSYKWQLFEKQSWRGPNLFRSRRKKAWALTLGLWGRRKEQSSTRDSAILIRELDEALQKKPPFLKRASYSIFFFFFYSMDVGRKMNECDGLSYAWMNLRTSTTLSSLYLNFSSGVQFISLS